MSRIESLIGAMTLAEKLGQLRDAVGLYQSVVDATGAVGAQTHL